MKNKREISEYIYEMTEKSKFLRSISKDDKLKFEKSKNINKKQNELYKKINFYKNIYKAIEKGEK